MNLRHLLTGMPGMSVILAWTACFASAQQPNILWLTAEDIGPQIGAYGDTYADTPNLDALARRSLRYVNASSTAPVCAAARTTLISGMYGPSTGAHHMRSRALAPEWLHFYPWYLQKQGYYTTNNAKEDYNLLTIDKGWDESSESAHWKNRPEGKPFFAIFNTTISHESKIREPLVPARHDPAKAPLPPYHPDVPEARQDWAQYYDNLSGVDAFVGEKLRGLEEAGLADDTIVFFFGDHGAGMPRGKRFAGWSGLRIPLIIHVPEKFRHLAPREYEEGGASQRLVSFVDFAPTLLSLAGMKPPDYYEGSAFMGPYETPDPEYSFGFRGRMDERPDMSRSVTDGRYMYIRNFMPHLPHGQILWYQQETPTSRVWHEMYEAGELNEVQSAYWMPHPPEELYDLKTDRYETRNLAGDPSKQETLAKMREALREHMIETTDTGFMPEPYLRTLIEDGVVPLEYARRSGFYRVRDLQRLLDLQLEDDLSPEDLRPWLYSASALYRYWATMMALWKGGTFYQALEPKLMDILDNGRDFVQVAAGEAIGLHTNEMAARQRAVDTLLKLANYDYNELILCVHALNALDHIAQKTGIAIPEAAALPTTGESIPQWADVYLLRLIDRLRPQEHEGPAMDHEAPNRT